MATEHLPKFSATKADYKLITVIAQRAVTVAAAAANGAPKASRRLLAAEAEANGRRLSTKRSAQQGDGRWSVEVEQDVADALAAVDADPDVAIRIMFTTGVGRA